MGSCFKKEDIFNILKEKYDKEIVLAIEKFMKEEKWGDIKIEMEILFQGGEIKRVTPTMSFSEHHKEPI